MLTFGGGFETRSGQGCAEGLVGHWNHPPQPGSTAFPFLQGFQSFPKATIFRSKFSSWHQKGVVRAEQEPSKPYGWWIGGGRPRRPVNAQDPHPKTPDTLLTVGGGVGSFTKLDKKWRLKKIGGLGQNGKTIFGRVLFWQSFCVENRGNFQIQKKGSCGQSNRKMFGRISSHQFLRNHF